MKIQSISVATPCRLPGKSAKTGIFKQPVSGAVIIDAMGLAGDSICNRKHHGGPDQAVYVEGSLTLDWWAAELGTPLLPGTFGENLVVGGLDNRDVAVGDRFSIGTVLLEATAPRIPCSTFSLRMGDQGFARRYNRAARPGIYCRVLSAGIIDTGQEVKFTPWSGDRVMLADILAMSGRRDGAAELARLLASPVSARLRSQFATKATT